MKYENLNKIFSIKEVNFNHVVIKVKANSPLTVARFPFVNSEMAYITITRGKHHVVTITKKDGKTFGFSFGEGSRTLICDSLELLKENLLYFIDQNNILIDYAGGEITRAEIYYNNSFSYRKWQLTTNKFCYWSDTATNEEEMIEECEKFIVAKKWEKVENCNVGYVFEAKNFKVTLK
jgi:hypothetical protein